MKLKCIILSVVASLSMAAFSQPTQQETEWEWYLGEVVNDVFVGRNYFEYYYMPSAADMEQQRSKGEVSYFLNSPAGLNSKKVRDMIDRLMASYDDIKVVGDWHMTNTTYWKEFRYDKNKFRFSVKRKALDDGTYYVSVTETAGYYKSLGKTSSTKAKEKSKAKESSSAKPAKRNARDRKPVTQEDVDAADVDASLLIDDTEDSAVKTTAVSERERRAAARKHEQERKQEERLAKRRAREESLAQEKANKEAEKQRKAEEKKQKEEEKRLKQEERRRLRDQERRDKETARKQAAAPKPVESKYHYSDVALWLSEKYDFTQTTGDSRSCTMYSTAVKDVEMAKLAIKNALKGSNARMTVPWRVNSETQEIETGYTVDGHVLVFAIGKNDDGNVTVTVNEISAEQFEQFKQSLGN
ncbi:MAG: hypothetical protein IKX18_08890 [Muribaculaceae bacterium]|nr:hypothetical protein [Muribaculaceae bacterium]